MALLNRVNVTKSWDKNVFGFKDKVNESFNWS